MYFCHAEIAWDDTCPYRCSLVELTNVCLRADIRSRYNLRNLVSVDMTEIAYMLLWAIDFNYVRSGVVNNILIK